MPAPEDIAHMSRALELAKRGWGDTSPNPMVGAVLVKGGRVVGEGFHRRDGAAHAEIECLRSASESPAGATLYVTLEPCSTKGRTGACCDAISEANVSEVKIGALDPNPLHCGRALEVLAGRGIKCEAGILEEECRGLNFIFNYSIVNSRALLAVKYAASKDGKIAASAGSPTLITKAAARADVMRWRRLFGAIGVGAGTLIADNPSLTARFGGEVHCGQRLVFDASLSLADIKNLKEYNVFADGFSKNTRIVCDCFADLDRQRSLEKQGISVMRISAPKSNPSEFWRELKERMFAERITGIYAEGGARVIASICAGKAADFAFEYRSKDLVLGESALGAFDFVPGRGRPFEIKGKTVDFGDDFLEFGSVFYK